ncbi:hypothetical protein B9Z55_015172 [Caenorhabditis nigoni]|uniref:Bestrophin homolog n=1 Tax=Caenorhabditis nigoni TaxID=1611254 RepID=A0A2G5U8Z5_9PELO|nr:hypothetical protein B9Z55_015172 [Caenorhabditis nigoni]
MTVSYNSEISSVSSFNFLRLMCRWRGSIWKSVLSELIMWITSYISLALFYHLVLFPKRFDEDNMVVKLFRWFNDGGTYFGKELHNYIPLTFMLAFFVSIIVARWRHMFANLGFIESIALTINATIVSNAEEAFLIRRNLIRYVCLAQVMVYRDISIRVRRRFPNMDSVKKAGFLFDNEEEMLNAIDLDYNKYWVPINWCVTLLNKANEKGYIISAPALCALHKEIKDFRGSLATLCNYDWCPIPIAYPQVVFFAVRIYFLFCLFSRQYIRNPNDGKEFEVIQMIVRPILTIIEFICILGWMKVAEALLNPLGEDDDDFETNFLIDKNIFTGMRIVDCFGQAPPLAQDMFSDPGALPIYSEESQKNYQSGALVGSVSHVTLAQTDENIHMVPLSPRLSSGDIHGHDRPSVRRRFKFGTASQAGSRASSFREHRLPRQDTIEGESNDGLELDYEKNLEEAAGSPTRNAVFFSNLSQISENDEDLCPATAKTSVVSRV